MTTNALDIVNKKVATDSRWSIDTPKTLFFIDNTGFDKICMRKRQTIMFAGDSLLIDGWKKWFQAPTLDTNNFPPLGRIDAVKGLISVTVMLLDTPKGRIRFRYGWIDNQGDQAIFAGTGAAPARTCFMSNGCVIKAVQSAAMNDTATGGETKFVELETGKNNLSSTAVTIDEMHTQLNERGFAMDKSTGQVMTITAHNAQANAFSALAGMTLSAPTGIAEQQWSESAIAQFHAVLKEIAAEETAEEDPA